MAFRAEMESEQINILFLSLLMARCSAEAMACSSAVYIDEYDGNLYFLVTPPTITAYPTLSLFLEPSV